jgi:hypothetical protein
VSNSLSRHISVLTEVLDGADCQKCKLSGYTTDGTFSQYVVSFVHHVTPIPKELPSADAASILCAGVTTYKALKVSNTHVGEWVVILGAGGGLVGPVQHYPLILLFFTIGAICSIPRSCTDDMLGPLGRPIRQGNGPQGHRH